MSLELLERQKSKKSRMSARSGSRSNRFCAPAAQRQARRTSKRQSVTSLGENAKRNIKNTIFTRTMLNPTNVEWSVAIGAGPPNRKSSFPSVFVDRSLKISAVGSQTKKSLHVCHSLLINEKQELAFRHQKKKHACFSKRVWNLKEHSDSLTTNQTTYNLQT